MTKTCSFFLATLFVVASVGHAAERLDDDGICRQILAKLPSHISFNRGKDFRYEIVSVDRIYEIDPTSIKGREFMAVVKTKWTLSTSGQMGTEYFTPEFKVLAGSSSITEIKQIYVISGGDAKYKEKIASYDELKHFRIMYPKGLRRGRRVSSRRDTAAKQRDGSPLIGDTASPHRLKALALFIGKGGEKFLQVSHPIRHGQRTYTIYVLCSNIEKARALKKGQLLWSNKSLYRELVLSKVVILDNFNTVVSDKELARRLLRAAAVQLYAEIGPKEEMDIPKARVDYIRQLTDNPVVAGAFAVQGAQSLLTSWGEKYKAVFLDLFLADADQVPPYGTTRRAVMRELYRAQKLARGYSLAKTPLLEKLPTRHLKKLDENWVLVRRRGKQWMFMRSSDGPDVGLGLSAIRFIVEFSHRQYVMKDRADMLGAVTPELDISADVHVRAGARAALQKAERIQRKGLEDVLEKLLEIAKRQGFDAATKALAKASLKVNMVLLAFEINNILFNMDGMYEFGIKAQCAAQIAADMATCCRRLEKRVTDLSRQHRELSDLENLERLYCLRHLAKANFHRYLYEFANVSGVGKDVVNAIQQGALHREMKMIKKVETDTKERLKTWREFPSEEAAMELLATKLPR